MIWVTWRQQRAEYVGIAVLLFCIAVLVVVTGILMRGFEGGLACLGAISHSGCAGYANDDFQRAFNGLFEVSGWLNVVPLMVGVFIGAPLLARELERGTQLLAWTQTVTRTRWVVMKMASLVVIAIGFGVAMSAMMTWWRQPWDTITSPFASAGFDFEGLMPAVYALFAMAVGVAAGTVIRRTLPAMAVTLVGFLAVRLPIEFALRAHFLVPLRISGAAVPPAGAWVLDAGLFDVHGNPVYDTQVLQLCGQAAADGAAKVSGSCLRAHGFVQQYLYQPLDRFWTLQFIEAGIFVGLSALLLGGTVFWVRRLR